MMKEAKTFLELCRHRFPSTRPHQSHSLTLKEDRMVLTLMLGDTWQVFDLDETDLAKQPDELLADVVRLFKKPKRPEPTPEPLDVA